MRLIAFLQGWDLLCDELGRPPSLDEYTARFALPHEVAERDHDLCRRAFPGQAPAEVLASLWAWRDSRLAPRPPT